MHSHIHIILLFKCYPYRLIIVIRHRKIVSYLIAKHHIVATENGTRIDGHRTERHGCPCFLQHHIRHEETEHGNEFEEQADEEENTAVHCFMVVRICRLFRSRTALRARIRTPPRMNASERSSISKAQEKY